MARGPHDTPSEVVAERGEVQIDGPGGIAVALTPAAAVETSDRLQKAAAVAARRGTGRMEAGALTGRRRR